MQAESRVAKSLKLGMKMVEAAGIQPAATNCFDYVLRPKTCPRCVPNESNWEHADRQSPPEACGRLEAQAGLRSEIC